MRLFCASVPSLKRQPETSAWPYRFTRCVTSASTNVPNSLLLSGADPRPNAPKNRLGSATKAYGTLSSTKGEGVMPAAMNGSSVSSILVKLWTRRCVAGSRYTRSHSGNGV